MFRQMLFLPFQKETTHKKILYNKICARWCLNFNFQMRAASCVFGGSVWWIWIFYVLLFLCVLASKIVQSIVLYAALIQIDKKHIVETHFVYHHFNSETLSNGKLFWRLVELEVVLKSCRFDHQKKYTRLAGSSMYRFYWITWYYGEKHI